MSFNLKSNYKYNNNKNITHQSLTVNNNNDKIISLCTNKLSTNPYNKRALLLRASIYIKINKFKEAQYDLQSLLDDKELSSTAYYLLGIISKQKNNQEQALMYLTKSIELDKDNINAYFLRGAVNNSLGKYKEAINDYNEAIYKDTMEKNGKNIYKNISKIFSQALHHPSKYSQKKRRHSLINDNNKKYIKQCKYNTDNIIHHNNNNKCISQENNIKILKGGYNNDDYNNIKQINIENEDINNETQKIKNIVVHSISNNFNFFIRDIADKKINDKDYDAQIIKEINGFLNEGDNDEKPNLISNNNNFNDIDGLSSIYTQNASSSMITNTTSNISHIYVKLPSSNNNDNNQNLLNFQTEQNIENDISSNNCLLSKTHQNEASSSSLNINNHSLSELGLGKILYHTQTNYYNKKNKNIIDTAINNNNCNSDQKCESAKNIINYSKSNISINSTTTNNNNNNNNITESLFTTNNNEQPPLFYTSEEKTTTNTNKNEDASPDEIYCINGEIARSKGKYKEAIDHFTKAIQINPKSFKAFFNRAFTYDKIGLYKEAINDYSSTILLKENHSLCYYNRGITYNKIGEYQKSISDFTKAISIDPNKPEFYFNRACLYKNIKLYQDAINDYTKVISLFPKLYTPVYNRGVCYEKIKNYELSIKDFEVCIQMNKSNIYPYYHLATINKLLERYDISINYLKQLIEIKPDYSPAYHDIGVILTQQGSFQLAIQYFNKCIELDNKKPIYYHNRGWAYRKLNPQNAISDISNAILLDNKNPKFYYNRASIYKNEKIYDKAINDYTLILVSFDKNNHDAYINRAFCFAKMNNFNDAINDYSKAIEINKNDFESLYSRADLYIKTNNFSLAIEDLNKVINNDSNNEKAYIKRAKCYENIQKIKESCNDYERALILSGKKP